MKVIFDRRALLAALSPAVNVTPRRNTIEILGFVLIDALMGECRFRATDLDMESVSSCVADVAEIGVVAVDALKLREAVQLCGPEVTLEHGLDKDPRLAVKSGNTRFRLPVLPPETLPETPSRDWQSVFEIGHADLLELLESVSYAVSKDMGQFYLTGVRIEARGGELWAVATNKHRIAKASAGVVGAGQMPGITVPIKMVQEVVSALGRHVGPVTVSVSEGAFRVQAGETTLTSKVIEADYLDFSRAIPNETPHTARAGRTELIEAIKRGALAGDTGAEGQGVRMTFSEGSLSLLGKTADADSLDEIGVYYSGPTVSVGVVARYMLEALSKLDGDIVDLGFGGSAVKITSEASPNIVMTVGTRIVPL